MNPLVISWLASITSVLADILKVAAVWTACIALGGAGSAGWTLVFAKKDMFGKKDKKLGAATARGGAVGFLIGIPLAAAAALLLALH